MTMEDEDKNLFYEQIASAHKDNENFVAKIKWLRMCAETAAVDTGCTRIDMLMMAIDYEIKQLTASTPRSEDDAMKDVQPLIEMLQEGIVMDASFFKGPK
jgi:hypothetical protein